MPIGHIQETQWSLQGPPHLCKALSAADSAIHVDWWGGGKEDRKEMTWKMVRRGYNNVSLSWYKRATLLSIHDLSHGLQVLRACTQIQKLAVAAYLLPQSYCSYCCNVAVVLDGRRSCSTWSANVMHRMPIWHHNLCMHVWISQQAQGWG